MKEAILYDRLPDKMVHCRLCAHGCTVGPGKRGICAVRENRDGVLYSLVYGKVVAANLDPIEKKPLFHFLPGTTSLSIATAGCNFRCLQCQNSEISQVDRHSVIPGADVPAMVIVEKALGAKAASISYTYTEPTIFLEYALDVMAPAKSAGLASVFVSNGFATADARALLTGGALDAVNVDIKAFSDQTYRKIYGGRLDPVLETVADFWAKGVWVEVTTLVIPGVNDTDAELGQIADFLAGISPDLPWHVSAFHPTYKMTDREPTPAATLRRAREIGFAAGLRYVYVGNIVGEDGEDTTCPSCKATVIRRRGFTVLSADLKGAACRHCGTVIAGRFGGA